MPTENDVCVLRAWKLVLQRERHVLGKVTAKCFVSLQPPPFSSLQFLNESGMSDKGKAEAFNTFPDVETLDGDDMMPELEAEVRHGSADKLPDADFFNSACWGRCEVVGVEAGPRLSACTEFEDVCDEDDMKAAK